MEVVKQTDEYTVIKKRSGRFGVKNAEGKWINGEDKVKILVAEGLIKAAVPAEKPAEEAPAEEAAEEAAAPADDAPAEETQPAAE